MAFFTNGAINVEHGILPIIVLSEINKALYSVDDAVVISVGSGGAHLESNLNRPVLCIDPIYGEDYAYPSSYFGDAVVPPLPAEKRTNLELCNALLTPLPDKVFLIINWPNTSPFNDGWDYRYLETLGDRIVGLVVITETTGSAGSRHLLSWLKTKGVDVKLFADDGEFEDVPACPRLGLASETFRLRKHMLSDFVPDPLKGTNRYSVAVFLQDYEGDPVVTELPATTEYSAPLCTIS